MSGGGRALRVAIVLVAMAVVFGAYWLALPIVRAAMLPEPDRAHGLLWVIGPATALRFGAATVLSAVTLPFLLRPLRPLFTSAAARPSVTPVALLIRAALLGVVYLVCGAFYFTASVEVADGSITFHSPLGARRYGYDEVRALEHQPPVGGQSDRYAMRFDDERWGYFDADCEGVDEPTVRAIAAHVSNRARRPWIEGGTR